MATKKQTKVNKAQEKKKGKKKEEVVESEEDSDSSDSDLGGEFDEHDEERILLDRSKEETTRQPEKATTSKVGAEPKLPADMINVDFVFCDPRDEDFHMVRSLVQQGTSGSLPGMEGHLSGFAEAVCEQAAVGTTITADDNVFAFISTLSSKHYSKFPFFKNFVDVCRQNCPKDNLEVFDSVVSDKGFAWLICERLVNIPNEVVPPLYQAIVDDIDWARKNVKQTGGTKEMFQFGYLVFLAAILDEEKINNENLDDVFSSSEEEEEEDEGDALEKSSKKRKSKDRKKENVKQTKKPKQELSIPGNPVFLQFEHELFVKKAVFTFPCKLDVKDQTSGKAKGAVPQRHKPTLALIGVISMDEFRSCAEQVQNMLMS